MTPAIELRGIHKHFGILHALAGIDLEVEQGEFIGLLGPNGAGKTTLISVLAGLARADRGVARIMGHDVRSEYRAARRALGVVPQELVFDPFFTVREALQIQSGYFGIRQNGLWIDEVMHHLDLVGKADANMRSLSGGMKRRVLVAQALMHKPPVIVLDEPTAGVDVDLRRGLWSFIRRLNRDGHTIVLTTHYLEEAEALCGRVAMLKAGKIVALDTTENLVGRLRGAQLRVRIEGVWPAAMSDLARFREDKDYMVPLQDYGQIEYILAGLRVAGCVVQDLELIQPDLEDVFVEIMAKDAVASAERVR